MTIPAERTLALINAREFLRSLLDPKQTPKVPKAIRRQAYWCLRHFPSEYDLAKASRKAPEVFGNELCDAFERAATLVLKDHDTVFRNLAEIEKKEKRNKK